MRIGSAKLNWTEKIGLSKTKGKNEGKTMGEKRAQRNYSEEFKHQIVQLYNTGKSRAEIIREYEITSMAFDRWVK